MEFNSPITDLISRRYSCRSFSPLPINGEIRTKLSSYCQKTTTGPMGGKARYSMLAAGEGDDTSLKGLGTYGFIRGATGFIIGATTGDEKYLEDFGYLMEKIILYATDLGLGTCWLGGTFTKSSFTRRMNLEQGEIVPCVTATGYPAEKPTKVEKFIRKRANSDRRLAWNQLFFDNNFSTTIENHETGDYHQVLEMVRKAPSASNRQPWRILKSGSKWHLFLQRTSGYRTNRAVKLTTIADLQRIDMGIAMCHFELSAKQLNLAGSWIVDDPGIALPNDHMEYSVTWVETL